MRMRSASRRRRRCVIICNRHDQGLEHRRGRDHPLTTSRPRCHSNRQPSTDAAPWVTVNPNTEGPPLPRESCSTQHHRVNCRCSSPPTVFSFALLPHTTVNNRQPLSLPHTLCRSRCAASHVPLHNRSLPCTMNCCFVVMYKGPSAGCVCLLSHLQVTPRCGTGCTFDCPSPCRDALTAKHGGCCCRACARLLPCHASTHGLHAALW
jgi:hypothetical protein